MVWWIVGGFVLLMFMLFILGLCHAAKDRDNEDMYED